MTKFEIKGQSIREQAKKLVLEYFQDTDECQPGKTGVKQAQIFKQCGFDWGNYEVANSTRQQYWLAAILWQLSEE